MGQPGPEAPGSPSGVPDPVPDPPRPSAAAQRDRTGPPWPGATPVPDPNPTGFVFAPCDNCGETVGFSRDYTGVEYRDRWMWIMHAYECEGAL